MSTKPNAGVGFELDAIAAVVLGGASIAGALRNDYRNLNWSNDIRCSQ